MRDDEVPHYNVVIKIRFLSSLFLSFIRFFFLRVLKLSAPFQKWPNCDVSVIHPRSAHLRITDAQNRSFLITDRIPFVMMFSFLHKAIL